MTDPNGLTISLQGVQIMISGTVLGLLLREHKVWVRMKDRLNSLWYQHCKQHDEKYTPLENGR